MKNSMTTNLTNEKRKKQPFEDGWISFPSRKMFAFLTNNRHRRPSNPTSSKEVSTAWEVWEEYSELLGSLWLGDGVSLVVSVTDHTSCLNRRYIRVFPKNRGKKPKMDGLNNGKTC